MPEENPDAPETPPNAPQDPPETPQDGTGAQIGDDPDALRAALAEARKDAAKYRTRAKDLEPLAAKAKELEDAQKTESERLTEKLTATEQRAAEAERRALYAEVRAQRPDLTPKQVERLQGEDVDELLADATEVYGTVEPPGPEPRDRPKERLRSGHAPSAEPEPDYEAIADRVRSW